MLLQMELVVQATPTEALFDIPQCVPPEEFGKCCEICDKKFANTSNLYRHMRNVHKVIRCAVVGCNKLLSQEEVEDHLVKFHKYSFRDKTELNRYQERVQKHDTSGTPLPVMDPYWSKHRMILPKTIENSCPSLLSDANAQNVCDTPNFIVQQVHSQNTNDGRPNCSPLEWNRGMTENEMEEFANLLKVDSIPSMTACRDEPLKLFPNAALPD